MWEVVFKFRIGKVKEEQGVAEEHPAYYDVSSAQVERAPVGFTLPDTEYYGEEDRG